MIYLVWSNDKMMWWGPGRSGYTRRLSAAGRYSHGEALEIAASAIPGDASRYGMLPELPVLLEDVEAMQAAYTTRYPGRKPEPWE